MPSLVGDSNDCTAVQFRNYSIAPADGISEATKLVIFTTVSNRTLCLRDQKRNTPARKRHRIPSSTSIFRSLDAATDETRDAWSSGDVLTQMKQRTCASG